MQPLDYIVTEGENIHSRLGCKQSNCVAFPWIALLCLLDVALPPSLQQNLCVSILKFGYYSYRLKTLDHWEG